MPRHHLGVLCLLAVLPFGPTGCGGGENRVGAVTEAGCMEEIKRQLSAPAAQTTTVPEQCRGISDVRLLQLARDAGAVHPPVATAPPR